MSKPKQREILHDEETDTVYISSKRGPLMFDKEDYDDYISKFFISVMRTFGGHDRRLIYVYPIIYTSRKKRKRICYLAARYIMNKRVGVAKNEEVIHLNEVGRDCRKKNLLIVPKGYRGHLIRGAGKRIQRYDRTPVKKS